MKLSIRDLKEITRLLLGVQHLTRREQIIEVHITIRVLKILDQKLELIENLRTGHQVAVQDQVLQEDLHAQAQREVVQEVVRRDLDLLEATAEAVHRDLGPLEVIALDLREVLAQ